MKLVGGSVVGALFTPVPWRLITDAALWSENWPGVPRPARGEIKTAFTNCSLCPAGCAARVRTVGSQPVSLAPASGHPVSHGAMCPYGLTGHHLPYRADRVTAGPVKEASAALADAVAKGEPIGVLDLRPNRTASWTYRRALAAMPKGTYIPVSSSPENLAVDLAAAKTVLSFGAPLMEGWGTPGNVLAAREQFNLIQVEATESHTAAMADLWVAIEPWKEDDLALGLAHLLLQVKPVSGVPQWFEDEAKKRPPCVTAGATGLSEQQIIELARELSVGGPAVALDVAGIPEIEALNIVLGAPGRTMVTRTETPVPDAWKKAAAPAELASVADRSLRVLLIDESAPGAYLPWTAIESKLAPDAVVVAFTSSREGYARHAKYVLPTAVYPEIAEDIPPAIDACQALYRMSVALVPPPAGMVNPGEFVAAAAGIQPGDAQRERADAIHKTARGTLIAADGSQKPVKEVSADDFWKALSAGAWWLDARDAKVPAPKLAPIAAKASAPESADLPLVAVLAELPAATAPVSPLMSKLYEESNLRLGGSRIALNPKTASKSKLAEGSRARLQTARGSCDVLVTVDASVPQNAVKVAARPEVVDICTAGDRAKVVRA